MSVYSSSRVNKGTSLLSFPSDFVVIDIETTGLSTEWDEIIEVGALKVSNGVITDSFCEYVRPNEPIPSFVTDLTGITDDDLKDARPVEAVLPDYARFIADSVVVGHNVNFDINFIYDYDEPLGITFSNNYIDTMRLSRRLHPDQKHHRLMDLIERYDVGDFARHRALGDCEATLKIYKFLQEDVLTQYASFDAFIDHCKPKSHSRRLDISNITPDYDSIDPSHPLYGRTCVFTGKLERMLRKDAMQLVVNLGGEIGDSVTKKTNYLILGNNDYCSTIKDGKSSKQKKAEKLIAEGYDIAVMPESVFYDLVLEE